MELEIVSSFKAMLARRSAEELSCIARMKRFNEILIGDPELQNSVAQAKASGIPGDLLRRHCSALELDVESLRPFWDGTMTTPDFDRKQSPLVGSFLDWLDDIAAHRRRWRALGSARGVNPVFDDWRNRQILRLDTELPRANADAQVYPVMAIELSEGCSVGCYFCGVSARKFSGYFAYRENHRLWRDILAALVRFFGPAAATTVGYWATDPFDNPDYLSFIEDVYLATGFLPQTTTAIPLRHPHLTRGVMELANRYHCGHPRFSVLNQRLLGEIHATFSAEELLTVTLANHSKTALTLKARAGRIFDKSTPPGQLATIACVTGFLINLMRRSIRMVTPCMPSETWPDGYRVLAEQKFSSAAELEDQLHELLNRHGAPKLDATQVLRFRPDLCYVRSPSGFSLRGAGGTITLQDNPLLNKVGELLNEGNHDLAGIIRQIDPQNAAALGVSLLINQLRRNELLDA